MEKYFSPLFIKCQGKMVNGGTVNLGIWDREDHGKFLPMDGYQLLFVYKNYPLKKFPREKFQIVASGHLV
jgi:hypothetical protein